MSMKDDARIQQLKKLIEADPNDVLAHFSLGRFYLAAGQSEPAVAALLRVVELNPDMSAAYQLLGAAYANMGKRVQAVEVLGRGLVVAEKTGDRIPRDVMADMLVKLGASSPTGGERAPIVAGAVAPHSRSGVTCSRCGRPGAGLEKPPFKGPLGERVSRNVCPSCWRQWITTGTKVINELGLVLSTPEGQEAYDDQMIEFLQLWDR